MSGFLCEELTVEIFSRLPTKSLLRFRSLSKSLCSIISSPDFIRMHTYRSPQKILIRHQNYNSEDLTLHSEDQLPLCFCRGYYGITLARFPYNKDYHIVGSCNGILCLYDNEHSISLWNPSIRRKLKVPDCPQRYNSEVNIGFDPITNDYKIVRVPDSRYEVNLKNSFVYSMKTCTWCEITSPTPSHWKFDKSKAVFENGKLHWLVVSYVASPDNETPGFYIMTFDLSSHVFGMNALPDPSWTATIRLRIIQGSLAVIYMYGDGSIRVYKDASWSVLLESKGTQLKGAIMNVLQPSSNGNLLIQTYYEGFKVYNLKLGCVQSRLVNFSDDSRMVKMEICSESLELLDMGTALEGN